MRVALHVRVFHESKFAYNFCDAMLWVLHTHILSFTRHDCLGLWLWHSYERLNILCLEEGAPGSPVRWTEWIAGYEGFSRMCCSFLQHSKLFHLSAILFYACYITPAPHTSWIQHIVSLPSTPPPSITQIHWQSAEGYHARPLNTWFKG